jgi:FkbM family methyltransferase
MFVRLVPAAYRRLRLDRVGHSGPGADMFAGAYWLYKRWIEDPHAGLVRRHGELFLGGDIIDVGANIGYTTSLFARAVEPSGRVYSFEPEAHNFERLSKVAQKHRSVHAVRSAVGDHDGTCLLKVNPQHPGDHQVVDVEGGADTVAVPMVSLDSFVSSQAAGRHVAFIKIDVQGHEAAVCRGMEGLLAANPDVKVSFEYSGSSSDEVVEFFAERGFSMAVVRRNGSLVDLAGNSLADAMAHRGYCDILAQR